MDDKLKKAHDLFYKHKYKGARDIFIALDLPYEAGLSSLMLKDLNAARKYFEMKKDVCIASSFGLIILNVLECKETFCPKYFQVRSFLEIYINLFIENEFFDWAQRIIDNYELFMNNNYEVPKFIARVLQANDKLKAVHTFASLGKKLCFYDAEVHYIDACTYIAEGDYENAEKCIEDCLTFAKEYYPILKLKEELHELMNK